MIRCRFVKKKFQMYPAYACLPDDIRQKTNRTRLIAACKRGLKNSIIRKEKTKEITAVSVVLYEINHVHLHKL
jgi:hypothetical protein